MPSASIETSTLLGHATGIRTLPSPLTAMVGRERERIALRTLLPREDVRLVTLTGPGGVGKTRLALHVATDLEGTFPAVAFVALAAIRDPGLVLPAIAQTLGVREAADGSVIQALTAALTSLNLLLVLDNLEQVASAPQIAELLVACPGVTVLATSRELLRVSGERGFPVEPLAFPAGMAEIPENIGAFDAITLFVDRAQSVKPGFTLDEESALAAVEICRRLDGLPLAIELAAARLRHLPVNALLARLEQRLPILTGGAHDQPVRQRTMRDAIAWSYDLLPNLEQKLFRQLAVFVGGFTLEHASAVTGEPDPLDGISSLVDKNLLCLEDGPGGEPRYRMLETIREFGLEVEGGASQVRQAHAHCFLVFAERATVGVLTAGEQPVWLARLDREHDNLRSAFEWLLTTGDAETALRLAGAQTYFWYYRGHLAEGRRTLERALAAVARAGEGSAASRAWALTSIGLLANIQGDLPAASSRLIEGLELWGETGESWGAAVARGLLGGVLVGEGRYDEAARLFEQGLARFEELGSEAWIAHAQFHLGAIAFARGDYEAARIHCRASATRYDEMLGQLDAIDPLRYLGLIACDEGDLSLAAALFSDNLERLRARGSRPAIATGLTDVATLAVNRGSFQEAAMLFGAAATTLQAERAALSLPARITYEAAMTEAERSLGRQLYEREHAAGGLLKLEEAMVIATRILENAPFIEASPTEIMPGEAASELGLTGRELDVLSLLVAGKTNPEIAAVLFIGHGTVRNHVSNILAKLGAKTRTEAAGIARQQGLL